MSKAITFYCLLFIAGCAAGSGANSANVEVIVNPYGAGDSFRRAVPIVTIPPAEKTCRPKSYSAQELRDNLSGSGLLSDEGVNRFFGEPVAEETELTPEIRQERNKPIRESVAGGWTKIGLSIGNNSQFFLVIDTLSWQATGYHDGQAYSSQGNLGDGYCSGSEGGFPFLYFVPPQRKILYKPQNRDSPLENLTLYLSGFPVVDRSGEPSVRAAQILSQGGGEASPAQAVRPGGQLIDIPNYNVDLVLTGYFLNQDGQIMTSGFSKRVSFNVTKDFNIY